MPFNLGMSELLIVLAIALVVFGAKRLPEIGSSMGKSIREFKRSLKEVQDNIDQGEPPRIDPPARDQPKKLSEEAER